ncbi:MAG TPA: polyphosphate kinase 2 family protein [Vicinamibacteria bacterium]|nr:polyphosphate kinase 2 family protein [Vicinamibacteria bacterium]
MPADAYRITNGSTFRLRDHDPGETGQFKSKKEGRERLEAGRERLRELQSVLYAHDRHALLLIFQAMDAAGKDSAIKHVLSGLNPQGCQVFAFKAPSGEELDHDFLWRTNRCLPERGRIGVFNRSYYEEVLIARVHPHILRGQKLPEDRVSDDLWQERFESINDLERHLARNGTVVRKFFLNVSKEEQRRRFLARLDEPEKHWKFTLADVEERKSWDRYLEAYEDMIQHTSTEAAPWYVVPADHKWFTRLVVADAIADTLEDMDPRYPTIDERKREELAKARAALEAEAK